MQKTARFRLALVIALITAATGPVATLKVSGPTYCPEFGGLIRPEREFCVDPDPMTGDYRVPASVVFRDPQGSSIPTPPGELRPSAIGLAASIPIFAFLAVVMFIALVLPRRSSG